VVRPEGDRLVGTSPTMRDHLRTRDAIEDEAQLETNIRVIDSFLFGAARSKLLRRVKQMSICALRRHIDGVNDLTPKVL